MRVYVASAVLLVLVVVFFRDLSEGKFEGGSAWEESFHWLDFADSDSGRASASRAQGESQSFDDFRVVQSSPERYFDRIVRCKVATTPSNLEFTYFPHAHYANDLDHATKIGKVLCADSNLENVRILVQPQEEARYFRMRPGEIVQFRLLRDRETQGQFALRFL